MGWRTQDAYEKAAEEQWRALPWQTRLRASIHAWLVVVIVAALLALLILRGVLW